MRAARQGRSCPRRIAVLVSGSGTNLHALLDSIDADPDFGGQVVVVASDRPGCFALERARQVGVPTVATALDEHPDRDAWEEALIERLAGYRPEIVVLAGFMRILSPRFLARWPDRVLNVHPSLLPAFRGPHAVRDALAWGVKVTGTTVHLVDEQVDHGPIIAQRAVPVTSDDDEHSLHERIKSVEHTLLPACVKLVCHDRTRRQGRVVRIHPAAHRGALTTLDTESAGGPQAVRPVRQPGREASR